MHSPFDQQSNQSSTLIPSRYELDKHQTNCKEVTFAKDLRYVALLPHRFEEKKHCIITSQYVASAASCSLDPAMASIVSQLGSLALAQSAHVVITERPSS